MLEIPPIEESKNEVYSEFEHEKGTIREITHQMNERAWNRTGGDAKKFDQWVKMRNEFIADKLKESGVEHLPDHFAAYHYFIGSGLPVGEGYPFDTPDGLVFKAIKEASVYL